MSDWLDGFDPDDRGFVEGYTDGRDPSTPEPSANRSHAYRHSWVVGRAEIEKRYIGAAQQLRDAAAIALAKDRGA